jgi:hypothetical protein
MGTPAGGIPAPGPAVGRALGVWWKPSAATEAEMARTCRRAEGVLVQPGQRERAEDHNAGAEVRGCLGLHRASDADPAGCGHPVGDEVGDLVDYVSDPDRG